MSGRGRSRKRGPSGGGTFRRNSPQHGHLPSSLMGPVGSARSQWPRASHCGLMHCTVKPGKYCMTFFPQDSPSLLGALPRNRRAANQKQTLARIVPCSLCGVKRKGPRYGGSIAKPLDRLDQKRTRHDWPSLVRLPSKHNIISPRSSTGVARFAAYAPHHPHHLPCVRQHRSMRATLDLGWGRRRGGGDAESNAWGN